MIGAVIALDSEANALLDQMEVEKATLLTQSGGFLASSVLNSCAAEVCRM